MGFKVLITSNLKELARKISDISPVRDRFSKSILKEIDKEFKTGKDPYGKPWTINSGRKTKLQKTGKLRKSFSIQKTESKFIVRSSAPYFGYLNFGTKYMHPKIIVPHKYNGFIKTLFEMNWSWWIDSLNR